ncbi:hypothetical protein [Endozoicomonas lisbonensis]|uniref:hypothetical protein n=1 Tax=Endozoicomonas lisbonensis TaxID=3120522 RepID=UPI003399753B
MQGFFVDIGENVMAAKAKEKNTGQGSDQNPEDKPPVNPNGESNPSDNPDDTPDTGDQGGDVTTEEEPTGEVEALKTFQLHGEITVKGETRIVTLSEADMLVAEKLACKLSSDPDEN